MANVVSTQFLLDGTRNAVVKFQGVLDTSDVALQTIADPATMQGIDFSGAVKASNFRIKKIQYDVEDGLAVNLLWDATADVPIMTLTGRGTFKNEVFGGIVSNAGAGNTGKILASTRGWSGTKAFVIELELVKTQ